MGCSLEVGMISGPILGRSVGYALFATVSLSFISLYLNVHWINTLSMKGHGCYETNETAIEKTSKRPLLQVFLTSHANLILTHTHRKKHPFVFYQSAKHLKHA